MVAKVITMLFTKFSDVKHLSNFPKFNYFTYTIDINLSIQISNITLFI